MTRFLTSAELLELRGPEVSRLSGGVEATIATKIEEAEAEAVSYLIDRYGAALPASPAQTPAVLKAKVAVIAHRRLVTGSQVSPALLAEHEEALQWLSRAARGLVSLGLAMAPAVDRSPGAILSNQGPGDPPALTWRSLRGW